MSSLKLTFTRTLRSSPIASRAQSLKAATRGITATLRNGSQIEIASKSPPLTPFIPPQFRSTPIHPTPSITTTTASINNAFANLLTALTTSLTSTSSPNLPHLTSLLRTYDSSPVHWHQYAHANDNKQYTRNLVHEVPSVFNLLLLVWTPGKMSPVHDHADAHCLMKVLKGQLVERRFAIPGRNGGEGWQAGLRETCRMEYGMGKVTYMSDQLGLHEISNPSPTEYAVSLHLYTPPNAALRGCHIYDIENGEARHIMQGAYDSVSGIPTTV